MRATAKLEERKALVDDDRCPVCEGKLTFHKSLSDDYLLADCHNLKEVVKRKKLEKVLCKFKGFKKIRETCHEK